MSTSKTTVSKATVPASFVFDHLDKFLEGVSPDNFQVKETGSIKKQLVLEAVKKPRFQLPKSRTAFGYDTGAARGNMPERRRHTIDYSLSVEGMVSDFKQLMTTKIREAMLKIIGKFGKELFNLPVDFSNPEVAAGFLADNTPISVKNNVMRFYSIVNKEGKIFTNIHQNGEVVDPTRMIAGTQYVPVVFLDRFTVYEMKLHANWSVTEIMIVNIPDPADEAAPVASGPVATINLNAEEEYERKRGKPETTTCAEEVAETAPSKPKRARAVQ